MKSPSAGTSICFSPFSSMFNGSPFHCRINFWALLVRGILLITNWCSLAVSLCCQFILIVEPFIDAVSSCSIFADSSTSAVNNLPGKFMLVLLLLRKPNSFTSKDGFTTCTLNLNASNLEGTCTTLPNLKFTSYNSSGVRSLLGLNSIVRASIQ